MNGAFGLLFNVTLIAAGILCAHVAMRVWSRRVYLPDPWRHLRDLQPGDTAWLVGRIDPDTKPRAQIVVLAHVELSYEGEASTKAVRHMGGFATFKDRNGPRLAIDLSRAIVVAAAADQRIPAMELDAQDKAALGIGDIATTRSWCGGARATSTPAKRSRCGRRERSMASRRLP